MLTTGSQTHHTARFYRPRYDYHIRTISEASDYCIPWSIFTQIHQLKVTDLDGKLALDYQTRFRRKNWRFRM